MKSTWLAAAGILCVGACVACYQTLWAVISIGMLIVFMVYMFLLGVAVVVTSGKPHRPVCLGSSSTTVRQILTTMMVIKLDINIEMCSSKHGI